MVALTLPPAQVQPLVGADITHQVFGPFGISAMVLVAMVIISTESRHRAELICEFRELVRVVLDFLRGDGGNGPGNAA